MYGFVNYLIYNNTVEPLYADSLKAARLQARYRQRDLKCDLHLCLSFTRSVMFLPLNGSASVATYEPLPCRNGYVGRLDFIKIINNRYGK